MCGGQICLCVGVKFVYVLRSLGRKGKRTNKTPRKSQESAGIAPGQSRDKCVYAFSCLLVFPAPQKKSSLKRGIFQKDFKALVKPNPTWKKLLPQPAATSEARSDWGCN